MSKSYSDRDKDHLASLPVGFFKLCNHRRLLWSVITVNLYPSKYGLNFWTAHTIARHSFSVVEYFASASVRVRLAYIKERRQKHLNSAQSIVNKFELNLAVRSDFWRLLVLEPRGQSGGGGCCDVVGCTAHDMACDVNLVISVSSKRKTMRMRETHWYYYLSHFDGFAQKRNVFRIHGKAPSGWRSITAFWRSIKRKIMRVIETHR